MCETSEVSDVSWEDKDVRCPYWHKLSNNYIVCEGLIDGTSMSSYFQERGARRAYVRRYCTKDRWRECEAARALDRKYEE